MTVAVATAHPPGSWRRDVLPGDFLLTHGDAWTSHLISFGERLRFGRPASWFTHAAAIVSADGSIVEALGAGVVRGNLAKYDDRHYVLVRPKMSDEDRDEAAAYAEAMVGREYGYLTVVSLGLALLVGGRFSFGVDDELICSGLVATMLERGPFILDGTAGATMPAQLAIRFAAVPPPDVAR